MLGMRRQPAGQTFGLVLQLVISFVYIDLPELFVINSFVIV